MQPESITAIVGGVVTVVLAIARLVAQHVRKKRASKGESRAIEALRARTMPDPRAASAALELCERVVAACGEAAARRAEVSLGRLELGPLVSTYETMLRRAPRAKLSSYVERTLPLFFLAAYYALTSVVAAEIDTFRSSARRLHLPDTICVLGRIGSTHVPLRIEPRGSLRPLVEGAPLEDQLCPSHAEENDLALATIREWTNNERDVPPVTIRPAYATAMTMHLVRADEGACVVCVARDRDDDLGVLLRALYRNEHTLVLRVDAAGMVAAACAGTHSAALVAEAVGSPVATLLDEGDEPRWKGRACEARTVRVGANRFIFVTAL
jgi:hypothetical protein